MKDPVVEEVRKVRHQIDAEYPDMKRYFEHLHELEKKYAHRLVRRSPQAALRVRVDEKSVARQ